MNLLLRLITIAALHVVAVAHAAAPWAVVSTAEVKAELVAHAPQGVTPGQPLWLGLVIEHQPHWHTYWKNPGDSGLPTALQWQLSGGVVAGDIDWPAPRKLPIGPLMNFGYEGKVLLPVALTVPAGFNARTLEVKLHADWLVCKDVCIPQSGDFALSLAAQAATAMHGATFAAAQAAAPKLMPGVVARGRIEGQELVVQVDAMPADWRGKRMDLLPETAGLLANAGQPTSAWAGAQWTTRVALDAQRTESPKALPAVLVSSDRQGAVQLTIDVTTPWPASTATAPPPLPALTTQATQTESSPAVSTPTPVAPPAAGDTAPLAMPLALLLALIGGALLNLMPCVFPVLSLKVLSFAAPGQTRRSLLVGGVAYTAGVVLSFMALAALLLALRAGGEQLGWGFQLQSPIVVAALAALFCLIGLNLVGVFEIGSMLPGDVAGVRASHPVWDHALTGVLAVAVAAPCTAPFMGASLGLALTLPTWPALAIFAALGLGMASPYLLASAWPAAARALPRPGAWMAHFRVLMAFPMFATVVWLVWVLGQQTGIDGAAALLGSLVALSFVAWAWGSQALGRVARRGFRVASLGVLGLALAWTLPGLRAEDTAHGAAAAAKAAVWQAWSPARAAELRSEGRIVFVDFTAAWCVTCQFNKRTTFANAGVIADFNQRQVALLRADWTRRDAAITAELARLGRSGVPVYALYTPQSDKPRLLSEMLTPARVHEALAALP